MWEEEGETDDPRAEKELAGAFWDVWACQMKVTMIGPVARALGPQGGSEEVLIQMQRGRVKKARMDFFRKKTHQG